MKRSLILATAAAAVMPWAAQAQDFSADRNHNESVTERPRPEYDPLGIRLGSIALFPSLTAEASYDDNIYATPTNKTSDGIYTVRPEVGLRTNWSRHELKMSGYYERNFYQSEKKESHNNGEVNGEFRLDILRDAVVGIGGEYANLHEPRTAAESSPAALKPVEYTTANGFVYGTYTFNRLRATVRLDNTKYEYEDGINRFTGASIDEEYRDANMSQLTGRLEYAVSPDTALILQAIGNRREYDNPPPVGTPVRDSKGWQVLAGVNTDLSHLIRGEVTVGYASQDYKSALLRKIGGFAMKGDVEWFITPLTTITFNGSRQVYDSGLVNLPSFVGTVGGVKVDHELRRNVILGAGFRYALNSYRGGDRDDTYLDALVQAKYLVNRHATLLARYDYGRLTSDGAVRGSDYVINRFLIALTLKM